nr:extracellular solute-binding protein [uncultured Marvinbryantia sp.]
MNRNFKKAAAALASLSMLAAMTGSAVSAEEAEQITLNVSHIFVDQADGQYKGWYRALDEYKETHPNVTIVEDTADNDAYKTKLKTQLAAGSVPDVFYAWGGGFTAPFVEAGIVENLDSYVEDGTINMDAMMPDICNNFYYNGSLYGLPLDSFIGVLMCNQELFDKYELEVPKTMDDLYEVSKVFNENGITPVAMGEKDKWSGLFPFGVLALRYGGVETTTTLLNGEGSFNQEFVAQTAQELQKMVDEGVFSGDSVALTNDEAIEEFKQGRAAMWYSGNWQVGELSSEGSPLAGKLTIVNWPAVTDAAGDQNAFVGGASATLVASATSEHKQEAVEFITFMSQHFSDYAYEEGAILPTWKYEGDMELKPFQETLLGLMESADGFCLAWDTLLDPETADVHSTSLQGIYAQQMTADDYIEAMAAIR